MEHNQNRLDFGIKNRLLSHKDLWVIATATVLIRRSPHLIAERMGPKKGSKKWDTILMSIVGLAAMAKLIVAGLDLRHGWTTGIPLPVPNRCIDHSHSCIQSDGVVDGRQCVFLTDCPDSEGQKSCGHHGGTLSNGPASGLFGHIVF